MVDRKFMIAGVLTLVSAGILASALAVADDDEEEEEEGTAVVWSSMGHGAAPVQNEQYKTECASCHTLYSPGLLPARSWQKIMKGLDQHFGDNAELPEEARAAVEKYLVENAADKTNYRVSARFMNSIKSGEAPMRITETRFFVAKHDEVPERMVKDNPKVKSFSNCSACHAQAENGNFNEHDVRVPGFERRHF